ncbi:hypothetical protein D9758_012808 [Tetrapyrgos nigripes]|uniref:DUF6534 domain-containing protein n=1 Tax=Tetrapyrgos nigripes TaxID=182062 RepID=A0A8H5CYG8_9AGAR|nr:hypothetical protein D9758_012808 [Tetrapyrgos nigripes]
MAAILPPSPPVSHDTILGIAPVFIGALISYLLMGTLIVQLYIYYMSAPNDRLVVKFTVYLVFVLDLVSTVATTDSVWLMLISGWGRFEYLHLVDWGFTTTPLWNSLSSAVVQVFFGWRVWMLGSHNSINKFEKKFWRVMTVLILMVSVIQVVGAVVSTARFFPINDLAFVSIVFPSTATWLAASATADVMITVCMTVLLRRAIARSRIEHFSHITRQTDLFLTRIIRSTIETAAITAGAAILELILFFRLPNTGLHIAIALILSKLYTNTLLASLNSRAYFRREEGDSLSSNTRFTTVHMSLNDYRDYASSDTRVYFTQSSNVSHDKGYSAGITSTLRDDISMHTSTRGLTPSAV